MSSRVSIIRSRSLTDAADVSAAVQQAVAQACDFSELVRSGQTVVLKPNVFCPRPAPTTTDPRVVVAVGQLALDAGAGRVIVAEGRSVSTARYRPSQNRTRDCFEAVGMTKAVEEAGFEIAYLEEDAFREVDVPGADILHKAQVPRTILDADVLINLPVMKIHSLTTVTLAIKNLHGIVSDHDKLFQHSYRDLVLARKLTDILRVRRPDLNVLDGLVGQEGDHAADGQPVEMGLIMASTDAVALDAATGAVMGLTLADVDTTRIAGEAGLGQSDLSLIEIVGESIDSVWRPFAKPDVELSEEKFPGLRICAGDYCRSCSYYVRRGLDRLKQEGLLDEKYPLTIVVGREPDVPSDINGPVVILGDCAVESHSVKALETKMLRRGGLHIIQACPPMAFRMRAKDMLD